MIGADGAENALGIAAAPNRWYKIKMIVQPEEQYILYIDDQLACSLPIRGAMPDVARSAIIYIHQTQMKLAHCIWIALKFIGLMLI